MLDTKQLKVFGIRFGRSFQMALRTSVMFSPDHPSLERPLEQSFNLLNEILKQTGQFTLGFVDNQVLINSVLTTEPALAQLEKEFLKRGIAAFTFEPGLTLARYRKIISLLSAPATVIEQAGGIREYLEINELQGGRIVAASRNQKKTDSGDTLIESDSEAYIISKQLAEEGPRDFMESLDALLESACIDPATRNAALAGLTGSGGNPNSIGAGYGVPVPVPNLVIDRNTAPGTGWDNGSHAGTRTTGSGAESGVVGLDGGARSAASASVAEGSQSLLGIIPEPNPATPNGYVITDPAGDATSYATAASGGYRTFMELVEDSVNRSLIEDKGNPRKSYLSLARILKESRLDTVLSHFPESRHDDLRTLAPEQLAAEYVEESTLKLIARRLADSGKARDKYIVEEDVLRLLARSLQATHMADRLALKLAKFFQEFSVPTHLQTRIQEELRWTALTPRLKFAKLMELQRYNYTEFRRLIEHIRELLGQRESAKAVELTLHYFSFLASDGAAIEAEELSRSIELLRTTKLGREQETNQVIEWLGKTLLRADVSELVHFQAANNLAILSQSASMYECFDRVLSIAEFLRQSSARDAEKHAKCCATGLSRLLAPTSIERLIEMYIANRGDASLARTAAGILRYSHPTGSEAVLKQLVDEKNAQYRIALLRLVSQIGPACAEAARKLLDDERWYVVRNMCNLLADLRDPALLACMERPLRHPDARVQHAALNALVKTRSDGRALLISACLPDMAQSIAEPALDELLFLRSPESVPGLLAFVISGKTPQVVARKALQVLGAIPGTEATRALEELAQANSGDANIRRLAQEAAHKRQANSAHAAALTHHHRRP